MGKNAGNSPYARPSNHYSNAGRPQRDQTTKPSERYGLRPRHRSVQEEVAGTIDDRPIHDPSRTVGRPSFENPSQGFVGPIRGQSIEADLDKIINSGKNTNGQNSATVRGSGFWTQGLPQGPPQPQSYHQQYQPSTVGNGPRSNTFGGRDTNGTINDFLQDSHFGSQTLRLTRPETPPPSYQSLMTGNVAESTFQGGRDTNGALNNIIGNSGFGTQAQTQAQAGPSQAEQEFMYHLNAGNGYQGGQMGSPQEVQVALNIRDVPVGEEVEVSPGTMPVKGVRWADGLVSGPSGVGQIGSSVISHDSDTQSTQPFASAGQSQHTQNPEPVPLPDGGKRPKPSYAFGVTSTHPTKPPTPPISPRRSPRLQGAEPSHTDALSTLGHQSTSIQQADMELLRSAEFNASMLRPVADLSQVFDSITAVFGEPGTGILHTQFVPPAPRYSISEGGGGTKSGTGKKYKGREYIIDPCVKSRHLDIEMYSLRVSHGMLLSFDLKAEARRDAINIGDLAEFQVLPGHRLPAPRRDEDLGARGTSAESRTNRGRAHIGADMLSRRDGDRRRNSNKDAWIVRADGSRRRKRDSDEDEEVEARERRTNLNKTMARAAEAGDTRTLAEASRDLARRSTGILKVGTTNVTSWRIVRVSAVVEADVRIPGKIGTQRTAELQTAWWAVPERAIVGIF